MLLNIILLLLGTVATLAAFGGDTWTKEKKPLPKRITGRGWVSLFCLAGALVLGTTKEIKSASDEAQLKKERDEARKQLSQANTKLDTLTADLTKTQTALYTANGELETLTRHLESTRSQLSSETQINLLTVLSKDNPITSVAWWLRLDGPARKAKDIVEFLSSGVPERFRSVLNIGVEFTPYLSSRTVLEYRSEGSCEEHNYSTDGKTTVDLPNFLGTNRDPRVGSDALIVVQDSAKNATDTSAAIAFRDLSRRDKVAVVTLSFCKRFDTREELQEFQKKHAFLTPTREWTKRRTHDVRFMVPKEIRDNFARYWSQSFGRGDVYLYLDNPAHLMMSCRTSISKVTDTESGVTIEFRPITAPSIEVGLELF
jgi:hypothetical protein